MALIVGGVCRYSIIATNLGTLAVTIVDVHIDTEGGGSTRGDAVRDTAGDILNNWTDHILPLLSTTYEPQEVRYVDLNTADGDVGTRSSTDDNDWPDIGGDGSKPAPANVYAKVRKNIEGRSRGARNGLVRLPGLNVNKFDAGDGNRLTSGFITDLDNAFEAFKDGIEGEDIITGVTKQLAVVHQVAGDTSFSQLSTFSTQTIVGTIRRRMPGYGD